jgi:GrpB-like predicted nucleotidyltransferase (UPF0157 family)
MHIPNVTGEHIGSTVVPACSGRAVIDLKNLYSHESIEPILAGLDTLGFQWVQPINAMPDEWPKGAEAIHYQNRLFRLHIHVQPADHSSVVEKRVFRDRLRSGIVDREYGSQASNSRNSHCRPNRLHGYKCRICSSGA